MITKNNFIALDCGAESGRAIVGTLKNKKIELNILHRFPSESFYLLGARYWDIGYMFNQMKNSLRIYKTKYGKELKSIGLDTWGVDFGLIGKDGKLLENPVHYRDKRTDCIFDKSFKRVAKQEIFRITGIQFMQINTLYQILTLVLSNSQFLKITSKFLMMPDLFNYFFTGNICSEYTIATTSQMIDANSKNWSRTLLNKIGIPYNITPNIVNPGTKVGYLLKDIESEIGLNKVLVIASACHDTASAVAAVPVKGNEHWAYLSSGTWSLLGLEIEKPIINNDSFNADFTNEGGVSGTYRFLKNIMGLWLLQECKRKWQKEVSKDVSYSELVAIAEKSKPMKSFINPNDISFLNPPDMELAIKNYCKKTRQDIPSNKGEVVRCILESLALAYRKTIEDLNRISGKQIKKIHIIGGGTQNKLLCQWTTNATNLPVIAGPVEATATGNILMQAVATGEISSLKEVREIVRNSFEIKYYEPKDIDSWEEAYKKYLKIIK